MPLLHQPHIIHNLLNTHTGPFPPNPFYNNAIYNLQNKYRADIDALTSANSSVLADNEKLKKKIKRQSRQIQEAQEIQAKQEKEKKRQQQEEEEEEERRGRSRLRRAEDLDRIKDELARARLALTEHKYEEERLKRRIAESRARREQGYSTYQHYEYEKENEYGLRRRLEKEQRKRREWEYVVEDLLEE